MMKNLNSRLLAILCFSLVLFPLFSQSTNVFNFQLSPTEVNALASAQDYSIDVPLENGIAISLPDPNGNFVLYRFFKNKVISPKTAQTYSDIYTLTGYSPSNPDHFVNIVLHNGVISGIVLNKENAVILIRKGVNGYSSSFAEMKHFECLTEQGGNFRPSSNGSSRTASNGATLRNYTMGVVITDEYETANGGGATAIATAVTTISELSALYKKELAVEFTADVRPETSAFNIAPPGGSSAVYGGTVVAAYFSVGEYDLGHVFHTTAAGSGWSGQAGLGVVCDGAGTPPNKARGWSQGENNNSYGFNSTVFHEVAHMFNASHTFNSNDAAICNASLNAATSYEPGSGTTIMAYPGVCGTHNITDTNGGTIFSSSPYFHISSLEQMVTYLGGTGNTCATSSSSGNTPPVAESNPCSAGSPLTIPLNTPFELVGSHTDANGDAVTYCWEQFDAGPPHGAPNVACGSTTGPIFRSYPPTTSPVRTFPSLEYVVNDANVPAPNTVGECLPSVARTLNFKLTVRDNHSTGGGIHCESLQLTVSGTAGPLAVTAPNTNVTWAAGSNTVTWNVNNTNSICSTVNILLSLDGGQSFPIVLGSNVSNNGTATVSISNNLPSTSLARIKVVSSCLDCVRFFDISNVNFNINTSCNPVATTICQDAQLSVPQGDPALNLNLTSLNTPIVSKTFNFSVNQTAAYTTTASTNNTGCTNMHFNQTINSRYVTYDFYTKSAGTYTFSISPFAGGGCPTSFNVMNIYQNSFNPANTCSNLVWSSGNNPNSSGSPSVGSTMNASLSECQKYVLVVMSWCSDATSLNTNHTVTFPSNPVFESIASSTNYSQTYIAVNTSTGLIASVSSTSNFTTLAAGNYCVYGINYYSGTTNPPSTVNPSTFVGQSLSALLGAGNCMLASNNCKPLAITGSCPTLSTAPANVTITNSTCASACTLSGGTIIAPSGTPCPAGSTLQYRVNGGTWTTTLPVYAQAGPAQTIETRCVCDSDNTMTSPIAAAVTTVPGTCTNPTASIAVTETSGTTNNDGTICAGATASLTASGGTTYIWSTTVTTAAISVNPSMTNSYTVTVTAANGCTDTEMMTITVNDIPTPPTITIVNNVCPSTSGTISATGCGAGTTLEWATNAGGPWSTTAPTYTTTSFMVFARCNNTTTGCVSTSASATTSPVACAMCPTLTSTPSNVSIINSACSVGCTVSGGSITVPTGTPCPAGSTLQYRVNGGTWTTTLPVYAQAGPAQSIETRCLCDLDGTTASPISTAVTTVPGTCTNPTQPTITIVNNVCPATSGTISATGCGAGTTLEWATNAGGPWSTTVPTYTTTAITVYARCIDNATGCVSTNASATTAPVACSTCNELFISEYIEGSSNNKCIEIYNPTCNTVTLTGVYTLRVYANGSTTPTNISLSGAILPNDVFVICNTAAAAGFLALADQTSGSITFNGDDAVALANNGTNIDIIGQIGCDPGTQWISGSHSTLDKTLVRNSSVTTGISVNPSGACSTTSFTTLTTEWAVFNVDVSANLGAHTGSCPSCCPTFASAPANVSITNSTCDNTCTVSGGIISAPSGTPCPAGSTLQYRVNGGSWTSTLPVYAQTGPAQTIETRCNCTADPTINSPISSSVTTVPGTCTIPNAPTITITNNVCPSTSGTISAIGCGTGTTLEWATNAAGPWSTTVPTYTTTAFTVYARCRDNITNCVSTNASATTAPVSCGTFAFTLTDPCSCNNDATLAGNDGTFDEVITVTGPGGFTITASCVGCTPSSLTFTEGPAGTYTSNTFTHVDNVGYTASISANGSSVGSISNKCAYPNVNIDNIGPFTDCDGQANVPLTATITGDNGTGTYAWSGIGVTGSNFNPSGLNTGTFVVTLNYAGVNNGNVSPDGGITPAYPGCIQPDTIQVTITQAVAPPVIADITVCENGNTTISVTSAPGVATTNTFTWDFETNITNMGVSQNSTVVATNAPTQTAGAGLTGVAFQAAGSGCTAAITSSGYDITNTSLADAVADNEYFEFCIGSPLSGVTFNNVSAMNWNHRSSGTGPISWVMVASNNLTTPILSGTIIAGSNCTAAGGAFPTNNTSTCYRVYYWGGTGATGTLRIDNMVITANYTVPSGIYNFYLTNPEVDPMATPVASGTSYNPNTTPATSPQNVYVTCVNTMTGCESAPDTVVVTVYPNPTLTIVQPTPVCSPNTVNVLSVNLGESPSGGTKTYYASMADAVAETNAITTGLGAVSVTTTIFVRYELSNGCYVVGQINVVINANPPAPSVPSTITVCTGGSTLITVNTNPVPVVTTWDFESGINGQGISSNSVIAGNGPVQSAGSGLLSVGPQAAGSGCTASITSTGYDITNASLADAIADNEYFEFCIGSTMAGFTYLGVNAINWNHRISATGPIQWALVTAAVPGTVLLSGTISGTNCSAAGGAIPLNTSTCYRVYYWGATNVSGTLRIDNFAINAQYQNLATYNWFNVNPDINPMATPVATGNSYDPMTTAATSPQTIWVNCNNGCVSPAAQVTVNAGVTPTVNSVPNQALCPGASTNAVTFSGTPTGVLFNWTNNNTTIGLAASGSGNIASFTAVNTTSINQVATITVTPSYTSGGVTCQGTPINFTITVYPNPIPTLTYTDASGLTNNDGIICQGAMATMTAGGGTGYVWSTGATTATVSTGTAGTYTVTVSNANGCTAITTGTIVVNPLPVPLINVSETSGTANDGTIYRGDAATLTATGGGTYLWNTGATTSSISVSPMVTTTYTVTVTNANGCTASATRTITVIEPPCFLVCSGDQNVTLAGGECNYTVPNLVTMAGPCLDGAVVPPPVVGFTGAFSYANRYFHNTALGSDPTYGNLSCTNTTGMPGTLVLTSADVLSGGNTCNWWGTVVAWTVPANGTISFNWATSTNDPGWDDFGYSLTNNPNSPTGMFGTTLQTTTTVLSDVTASGMLSIPVTQGQIFSLVNYTEDATSGPLTATITNFRFQAAVVPAPWVINHVSGPEAGDVLAPGTYTLCYELLNPAGDATDDCCFDIVVEGYPTPTRSLVCNSRVNISADENCEVSVNADMFLEGGPYACYESYQINIWPFNSKANAIKDIAQNTGIYLPCGEHTYEIIDPVTGNICWGTFIVEDKIAPVVTCNCQDIDIPTPVTSFAGSLDATDPLFDRCGFTGYGTWPYDVYQFTVTVSGSYTFTASSPAGDTYAYINSGSFDPANPCVGMIAQNDDSAGGLDPLITVNLTAGTTYYYIFTNWSPFDAPSGAYTVTITGPGQAITIVNPSDAPACQFSCYELDVVKGETVGMLYDIPGQNANKSKLTTPPAVVDACGGVSMTFEDRITKTNCGDTKLIRDWKFTDAKGNVSLCSQTFTFGQITVFDLVPPVREVHLSCGLDASPAAIAGYLDVDSRPQPASTTNIGAFADDYAQTPYVVEWNEGYQYGYFTYTLPGYTPANTFHSQKVDNSVCNIYTTYTDDVIPACGIGCSGNMKVIRNWKLLDWCTGEVFTYTQVIKATDEKAPSFNVKNATISVDPWGCKANWTVEKPWELEDNCAKSEEIKWGVKVPAGLTLSGTQPNYSVTGMPKGTHAIVYWAEDCCGNITEKTAYVTVIDGSAPVAVAKQNIVMSLTGSGNGADGAGKIYGWQIDNGSYDHCSDVRFEVRRVDGGSCGNVGANGTHNNNSTYNNHNGYPSEVPGAVWFHPMDNAQDTDGGEFVKFCCEDIPSGADHGLHDVELRVWDDGNMNGIYGDNDIIYNGVTEMKDNYNTTWVTIRVENKLPPTLICPKDVTVTCDMELNLSEGVDTKVSDVNLTMTGYPKAYDLCSNLDITYSDQWVGQHDPVCKSGTIRRTFKVTKGSIVVTCTQFITVTTITVPFTVTFPNQNGVTEWTKCNFTLDDARDAANASIKRPIVNYGQCDIVGENITIDTFLFEDGACKKWRVKYSYKNWCTGEEINTIAGLPIVHWYAFKDVTAPVLSCSNQMFAANPNPLNPNGGCEASVALEASASDALICAEESWIKWQMFFDGWNNGTVDRLGSSFVNKSWNGIWVPQAKYIAGVLNPTWVALQNQHPNLPLADLVYVTYIKPTKASGETVKLPVGTGATAFILNAENINHKVLWKVTDGCGNVDQCESTVMVVDKKAPTPYCVSVSTALMQTSPKMVELWARDFDKGAFDNCSPQSKLYFTFEGAAPIYSRVNEEHYYKVVGGVSVNATATEYAQGKAYKWLPSSRSAGKVFLECGKISVQINVWDEAWNTDFCSTEVDIIGCGTGNLVSGKVATALGNHVDSTLVSISANLPEYPKTFVTNEDGVFDFDVVTNTDYQLRASKDGDYSNGVTTLDLVLIQRHILGLEVFSDPYKVIAADANNDGKITASDLVEIRKLILGVTDKFKNASWRFPIKNQVLSVNQAIPYIEHYDYPQLNTDKANQDFVAVKIGDINSSVQTNILDGKVEGRTSKVLEFKVDDQQATAGHLIAIPVKASNFNEVFGFQFTGQIKNSQIDRIESGKLDVTDEMFAIHKDGKFTMSFASKSLQSVDAEQVLFTIYVRPSKNLSIQDNMSITSDITNAEYYDHTKEVGKLKLKFISGEIANFELFQNEPNPFKGQTTVMFTMPEAATATLSVHDVTGKVVAVRNISAMRGQNSEVFTKDQLGVSGVLYYTLKSGDFTATKKMIIVE